MLGKAQLEGVGGRRGVSFLLVHSLLFGPAASNPLSQVFYVRLTVTLDDVLHEARMGYGAWHFLIRGQRTKGLVHSALAVLFEIN